MIGQGFGTFLPRYYIFDNGWVLLTVELGALGVACMAVNDPFVMQAWGQQLGVPDGLRMLSDGNGDFVRALGLEMDASAYGMGRRAKRFSLYAEDGVIGHLFVEAPGEFKVSSAEHMLAQLDRDGERPAS